MRSSNRADSTPAATFPLDAPTVPAAFQRTVATYPDRTALRSFDGRTELTWSRLADTVRTTASGLNALGVSTGDTVAIMLPNTIECHAIDYATTHLGAVPFAIFNSAPVEQITHQLRNADTRFVVTNAAFADKVAAAAAVLGAQVEHVVVVDGDELGEPLTLRGLRSMSRSGFDFEATWRSVTADDLATLIYTSGTTGPPKAAQWSHRTVMAQQRALDTALPIPTEDIVSFLPMAHAGGRITVHYMALAYGATITECPDPRKLMEVVERVRPDAFFSVPRFWEKIRVAIEGMIQGAPEPTRETLERAVQTGLQYTLQNDAGATAGALASGVTPAEYDAAVTELRPLLIRLGLDRVKSAFVGGAPSTPELSRFFRAIGVPMLEAYGLTEGSLNIFNRVDHFKCGTAGTPLPGVELQLAADGELLVRSDQNFVGYRNQPDATAEAVDTDGWLHTGDIAVIDGDGFVRIVDRKKELLINSAGKNMSPVTIESAVSAESSLIGQVMAVGDRRKFVAAVITLDPEAVQTFASQHGLSHHTFCELACSTEVHDAVAAAVERGNQRLNSNEQVKKFAILADVWQPDTDVLTPTAKLKRRAITERYADRIEALYS